MRLIAQQSVQPTERDVQPALMPSVAYDGIRLQIPRPTPTGAARRRIEAASAIGDTRLDPSRDLGPARGAMIAIAIGSGLWIAILLSLRSLVA